MSIKLMMEVERAHARLDTLDSRLYPNGGDLLKDALARIEKLEGELKAMKARMGKKETVEI